MMLVASSLMVQARWPQARKSTVCVCWLVETISTLPNTVRVYVRVSCMHACEMSASSSSQIAVPDWWTMPARC